MVRFLSGFQHPRLSVSALPPLLPRQRFSERLTKQSRDGKSEIGMRYFAKVGLMFVFQKRVDGRWS